MKTTEKMKKFERGFSGGNIPKTLVPILEKYADRISEVYCGPGYTVGRHGQAYDILLEPGWCVHEDGWHTVIEGSIAEVREKFMHMQRCLCDECNPGLEGLLEASRDKDDERRAALARLLRRGASTDAQRNSIRKWIFEGVNADYSDWKNVIECFYNLK